MKILQISPQVPLPLDNGGRIGIYGIVKHLSDKGHKMTFMAYRKEIDYDYAYKEMSKFCNPVILDVKTDNNRFDALLNLFSSVPYNISKFIRKELESFLIEFFMENKVDIVHIDHLHMGWCENILRELTSVPIILREHNLEYKIMQRYSERADNVLLKQYASMQFKKLKKYEALLCEKFDLCVMVSEEDEMQLKKLNPKVKTVTIPAGVDSSLLKLQKSSVLPRTIAHVGDMSWLPNYDGLNWYLNEVFPDIVNIFPDIKLFLYGKGNDLLKIPEAVKNNVIAVGYVKDIWGEILDKQLCIVPLRVGSGIRIKILEMLAAGKNILSTSIGKEGIMVKDNEELLVADSASEFVDKTIRFFNNQFNNDLMVYNAKEFIRNNYTWEVISERFEKAYMNLLV